LDKPLAGKLEPQHHWLTTTVEGSVERGGEGGVKAMGPAIACPFEISGRAADVTNLRSPFNPCRLLCENGM
jgi:hypothetical protein